MKLVCPRCKSDIPIDDVDFSSESAFCYNCQLDFDCRSWITESYVTPANLQHPPKGAWFKKSPRGFRVGVSTRSFRWLPFLPVACIWTGILLFFSYACLHAPPDARWYVLLFFTPFYLVDLFLWGAVLMAICGSVVVEVDGNTGRIFKGIGVVGWSRHFDTRQVNKIRISTVYGSNAGNRQQIALEGQKVILLATGVRPDRLRFMLVALHQMHRAEPIDQKPRLH